MDRAEEEHRTAVAGAQENPAETMPPLNEQLPDVIPVFTFEKIQALIDAGADVYAANDVHGWLQRLARDSHAERPKPWLK